MPFPISDHYRRLVQNPPHFSLQNDKYDNTITRGISGISIAFTSAIIATISTIRNPNILSTPSQLVQYSSIALQGTSIYANVAQNKNVAILSLLGSGTLILALDQFLEKDLHRSYSRNHGIKHVIEVM